MSFLYKKVKVLDNKNNEVHRGIVVGEKYALRTNQIGWVKVYKRSGDDKDASIDTCNWFCVNSLMSRVELA